MVNIPAETDNGHEHSSVLNDQLIECWLCVVYQVWSSDAML